MGFYQMSRQLAERLTGDCRWGAKRGAVIGAATGVVGVLRYLARDMDALGTPLQALIIILFASTVLGVAIGGCVGILRPVARRGVGGAVMTGSLIGAVGTLIASLFIAAGDPYRFARPVFFVWMGALGALAGALFGVTVLLLWSRD